MRLFSPGLHIGRTVTSIKPKQFVKAAPRWWITSAYLSKLRGLRTWWFHSAILCLWLSNMLSNDSVGNYAKLRYWSTKKRNHVGIATTVGNTLQKHTQHNASILPAVVLWWQRIVSGNWSASSSNGISSFSNSETDCIQVFACWKG